MITTFIISLKILKYGVEIMRGHKFLRIYEWVWPVSQVTGTSGRGGSSKENVSTRTLLPGHFFPNDKLLEHFSQTIH